MKINLRRIVLIFIILLPWFTAGSVVTNYSYYQLSLEQGLSQATIVSILQDHKGVLWLGTKKGVNAFKQHKLTAYTHNPLDTLTLPDNNVHTLAEDRQGGIWVGTNRGLSKYDDRRDKFVRIASRSVYSSLSTGVGLFFGGDNLLYRYDYDKDKLLAYKLTKDQEAGNTDFRIVDIAEMSDGRLVLATKERGIYMLNIENMDCSVLVDDSLHLVKSLCVTSDKNIYVSTQNSGLYRYTLQGMLIEKFTKNTKELATDFILDLLEYEGELWICTDGEGIKILNLRTREFRELMHNPGDDFTIPTNSITTLYADNHQQLWAGSVRKGVFCVKETYIKTFGEKAIGNPNGLTESAIVSLYEEENGLLWIGTDGGGINLFNPQTNRFKHFPSTYGDKIISIAELNKDELLVSIYTKGVFIFNKHTAKYTPFTIVDKETNYKECFYGYLPMAHMVAEDKIYILGERCWIYCPSTRSFKEMKSTYQPLKNDGLVLAHSNSRFSLLMNNNQVYKVDQADDVIALLFELSVEERVVSLAYDEDHLIWVATNRGLGYYDMEEGSYVKIPTKLFDSISFILYDGKDRLWVGAQSRLFAYSIKENKFTQINRSDGFIPNEILFAYQNTSKKHYIYLGGSEGLVQICTDIPKHNFSLPQIALEDVLMDGQSIWQGNEDGRLKIPHNYSTLSLMVRINAEDVFQRNLIKYSLVKDGVSQDFETYATRHNLPASLSPGTYEVKVSCTTKSGDLTPPVKLAEIVVMSPWYRSFWFFLALYMVLLVLLGVVVKYIYYRKAKQVRKKMYVYKQHVNEEKINFLINVNHELRTPLTLIYAPLKRLLDKGKEAYDANFVYDQLQRIMKQASRMYQIINMVLDLNRLEIGHKDVKMEAHDLNEWVKSTAEDFSEEAQMKGIKLKYDFDLSISRITFDEWKCQIIFSNIISNAIKFGHADTNISIETRLTEDGFVRVAISNESIGLTDYDVEHLFDRDYENENSNEVDGIGLYYSKILINVLGGRIGAYNGKVKGTTLYYDLPLYGEKKQGEANDDMMNDDKMEDLPMDLEIDMKMYSILVVEDTDELRNFLSKALKETFKEVYSAVNGQEALDLCYEKDPDIVVSDVTMPVMDGFELCRRIKNDSRISHTIVILLTARCSESDENLGYKLGTDCYVKKPFDVEFLKTVISNLLKKRKEVLEEQFYHSMPSPMEITYSKADEEFLQKINEIIKANLSNENLNLKLITKEIGMSRATLYNKMIKITGIGVNDYVNRMRIEKAAEYLLHSDLTIKEISQEVGFSYPRYFSTSFKNLKGMTPTQFKEKYGLKTEEESDLPEAEV